MDRQQFLKTIGAAISLLTPSPVWGDQPSEARTFTSKTVNGCDIKLDVYGADPKVRKPVIVHIHGGAMILGSRQDPPQWLNLRADHALISIDYRLAPETKLPAIIEDVQDAFRWVHQQGSQLLNIDTGKLVVEGESAGGYLTLMTGFCVTPRPQALISVSGYGGIVGPWYSRPSEFYLQMPRISKKDAYEVVGNSCVTEGAASRLKFYFYCRQNGIWPRVLTGHNPDVDTKWFDRYCPVRNVSGNYPPTVLIHGTADNDVPYQESAEMDKALAKYKVPHKFISVPGGGHVLQGVLESEQKRIYDETLAFVKEHAQP